MKILISLILAVSLFSCSVQDNTKNQKELIVDLNENEKFASAFDEETFRSEHSASILNLENTGTEIKVQDTYINFKIPNVYFDTAKHKLKTKYKNSLKDLISILNSYQGQIIIDGHADTRGSIPYNQKLSMNRSLEVKNFLLKNNVLENRIIIRAFGEGDAKASNYSTSGRKLNRRVEINLMN